MLLPCRNAAEHLEACLGSLASQSLARHEVVAVDDGSTDATGVLLRERARRDPRLRVLETGGEGLVWALQLAASRARAPLLARMDADDVAHPSRLERQRELLDRRRDLAACGTGVELFPEEGKGEGWRRYERWINGLRDPETVLRDLFVECPVAHPSLMIRAAALRALGGYRHRDWPEDYDLLLRLHRAGMRVANHPEVLLRWRLHDGKLSLRSARYAPEAFRRLKAHFLVRGFLPEAREPVVWGAGRVGKAMARELVARGRPPVAFVELDPRKIGQRIHGAPVLDPAGFLRRYPHGQEGERGPHASEVYVLVTVGTPGAREEIRRQLRATGRREPDDFRAVA